MAEAALTSPTGPNPRVDERVLQLLSEHSGRLAFNGLRRALGVHPEALTRALRRLEREGSIDRVDGGYALREPVPSPVAAPEENARIVASLDLAPSITVEDVFGRMAGRWFGRLRWVGVYERPGAPWLVWAVPPTNGHVLLAVDQGTLRVMVDGSRADRDAAILDDAARDLLSRTLTYLRPVTAVPPGPDRRLERTPDPWAWLPN